MVNEFHALQARAAAWHRQRFPRAEVEHVALKLCSEAGEVADAVIDRAGHNGGPAQDVLAELADVVVVAVVLAGRWLPDADLLGAVEEKLDRLCDPKSGHQAALRGTL